MESYLVRNIYNELQVTEMGKCKQTLYLLLSPWILNSIVMFPSVTVQIMQWNRSPAMQQLLHWVGGPLGNLTDNDSGLRQRLSYQHQLSKIRIRTQEQVFNDGCFDKSLAG